MYKTALHIILSLALSLLVLGETVGLYVTKDVCTPCGSESIELELVTPDKALTEQQCCSDEYSSCSNTTECCSHNDASHEHQKEHYYLTQTPVFFDKIETQDFEIMITETILWICFNTSLLEHNITSSSHNESPPLPSGSEHYRSFLCIYLI